MHRIFITIAFCLLTSFVHAQTNANEHKFSFEFEGLTRVGILHTPANPTNTLVVLIPGDGPTDVRNGM